MNDSKQRLFSDFFQIMVQMRRLLDKSVQDFDHFKKESTILQTQALKHIDESHGLTIGELSQGLNLSKSSTAQLVNRLINLRLIKKNRDDEDHRIIRLYLTKSGLKHLNDILNLVKHNMTILLNPISNQDLKTVIRIFGDILHQHN